MRNLKRALALVMATAMLLSMMVVGAGASYEDFTDSDEIENTEAVGTMVTLGVISGRDTGAFDPTGTVTRAEMAKMIAVSLNGGSDPILGSGAATTTFTDTSGHWAEAYIAYCANLGIINGYGDGTFGPDDTVTGTAAAKMMLTALGYDSATEGYTGTGWDLNVDTDANAVGLYEGFESVSVSAGLTRDYAAQLIYNGVCSQEIYYYTDDGTGIIYAQNDGTMLNNRFGVVKVTGVVTANEYAILDTDDKSLAEGRTTISSIEESGDHSFDNDLGTGEGTFYVSTDASLLGCTVNLYVKEDKTTPSSFSKATVVGDPVLADETVVGYTEIFSTSDYSDPDVLSDIADIYDLTLDLSANGETTIYYNYNNDTDTDFAVELGQMITVVDSDDNGTADYVFVVEYSMGEVSTYSTSNEEIRVTGTTLETKYDFDDCVGYDDVEHKDFVNFAEIGGKLYVVLAETVEGELTNYSTSGDGKLYVDGTTYEISDMAFNSGVYEDGLESGAYFLSNSADDNLDEDITIYLDIIGNVIAATGDGTSSDFAMVTNKTATATDSDGWSTGVEKVKMTFSDGTTSTYELNDDGLAYGAITIGQLYFYEVDGDEIDLYSPADDNDYSEYDAGTSSYSNVEINNGKVSVKLGANDTQYADEDTTFFYIVPDTDYYTTQDFDNLTGDMIDEVGTYISYENVSSLDMDNAYAYVMMDEDSGKIAAIAVITDSTALTSDWLYVYSKPSVNSTGVVINAIIGDDLVTSISTDEKSADVSTNVAYKYSIDDDGVYSLDTLSTLKYGNISYKSSSAILVDGEEYEINSDTVIGLSDSDDTTIDDVGLVKGDFVCVIYDDDEAVAVIVIEAYATYNAEVLADNGATKAGDSMSDLIADLIVSSGATVGVYKNETKAETDMNDLVLTNAVYDSDGRGTDATLTTTNKYYVVVLSEDESAAALYTVTVTD